MMIKTLYRKSEAKPYCSWWRQDASPQWKWGSSASCKILFVGSLQLVLGRGKGGGAGAGEWTCKPSRLSPYVRAWALGKRGFG